MMVDEDLVELLITEFVNAGLTGNEARRSAFITLTYHDGWNAARTARYLGISRARVSQKIDRLREYADNREDMPILMRLLKTTDANSPKGLDSVGFTIAQWDDPEFAMRLLYQTFGKGHGTGS